MFLPVGVNGIADIANYQFKLSPNPTRGIFAIDYNYTGMLNVRILNLLVDTIRMYTGAYHTYDISTLPAGVYEVEMCSEDQQVLKVLKLAKE